jgi:hypothetical protein
MSTDLGPGPFLVMGENSEERLSWPLMGWSVFFTDCSPSSYLRQGVCMKVLLNSAQYSAEAEAGDPGDQAYHVAPSLAPLTRQPNHGSWSYAVLNPA